MRKNYKDLVIYFTRYVHIKSIKMLNPHYHNLVGKLEEHKGKKYSVVDDYMPSKILHQIKEIIDTEKIDDTKILIDTDNNLPDDINLKNAVILMACVIKGDGKGYLQIFLEEALLEA